MLFSCLRVSRSVDWICRQNQHSRRPPHTCPYLIGQENPSLCSKFFEWTENFNSHWIYLTHLVCDTLFCLVFIGSFSTAGYDRQCKKRRKRLSCFFESSVAFENTPTVHQCIMNHDAGMHNSPTQPNGIQEK